MAFVQYSGEVFCRPAKLAASTAVNIGDALVGDGSTGALVPAGAASGPIVGISPRKKSSGDSDYASVTEAPFVIIPHDRAEFLMDVGTGTATAAMVGNLVDLKDDVSVDVTASAVGHVLITGFVSGTQVIGKFQPSVITA